MIRFVAFTVSCVFVFGCNGKTADPDPDPPACTADCNGALAGVSSCADLNPGIYSGGTPTCTAACTVDTTNCTPA